MSGRSLVTSSSNYLNSANALAMNPKDQSRWPLFNQHGKALADAMKRLLQTIKLAEIPSFEEVTCLASPVNLFNLSLSTTFYRKTTCIYSPVGEKILINKRIYVNYSICWSSELWSCPPNRSFCRWVQVVYTWASLFGEDLHDLDGAFLPSFT